MWLYVLRGLILNKIFYLIIIFLKAIFFGLIKFAIFVYCRNNFSKAFNLDE